MKVLLFIAGAGIAVYLGFKLFLYIYRPIFLSKKFREIDLLYGKIIAAVDSDVDSAIEDYRKWQSGDKILNALRTEEEIIKSINTAKEAKAHEEAVHEKFLRLRERLIQDPKKFSDSIVTYRRYLNVKLKQRQDASLFANAVASGAMSLDEMTAAAKETMVVLDENERKLDILLS